MHFVRHVKRPEWGVGRVMPDGGRVVVEFEFSAPRRFEASEPLLERVTPPNPFVPFGSDPSDPSSDSARSRRRRQRSDSNDLMDRGWRLDGSYGCGRRR